MGRRSSRDADQLCARMADEQLGLFSLRQARAAGLSCSDLHRRVSSRRLTPLLPRVYRVTGAPRSWRQDVMAACVWAGEGSAASHRTAALLWRLEGFLPGVVEVSTVGGRKGRTPGIVVHRVGNALLDDIVSLDPIPVTSARRTLLDLAGIGHPRIEPALREA